MNQKICRLCFKKKTRPIGIFTAKGIKLKIVSIIRMHFSDEVSEDDALPKFVCSHCWTHTTKFHAFYNTVIDGKNIFLANSVGNEEPTFNEINCDSFGIDVPDIDLADVAFMKFGSLQNEEDDSTEKTSAPFYSPFDSNSLNDCDSINRDDVPQRNDHEISEINENVVGIETVPERYPKYDHGAITKELATHPSSDLTCDFCETTFQSLMDAKSHYRKVHKNPHGYIKCCGKRLKTRGHLIEHIQWHMNPDIFKCQECQKLFDRKHTLTQHMKMVHSAADKSFQCDVCKSTFKLYNLLKVHILHVHVRKFEQICDQCGKVYVSKAALKKHKRSHDEMSGRVQCTYCSVMMRNEFALSNHISRIHKSSPANCPHCPKISPNRSALASHILTRHNFKVHKCHMCDRVCKSAMALKEHLVTHTDAYLYQCVYCPKKFKSHSNMYQHFREAHPVEWSVDRKTKPREKKPKPESLSQPQY